MRSVDGTSVHNLYHPPNTMKITKFYVISTGDVAIFGKIRSECRNERGKPIRDGW